MNWTSKRHTSTAGTAAAMWQPCVRMRGEGGSLTGLSLALYSVKGSINQPKLQRIEGFTRLDQRQLNS